MGFKIKVDVSCDLCKTVRTVDATPQTLYMVHGMGQVAAEIIASLPNGWIHDRFGPNDYKRTVCCACQARGGPPEPVEWYISRDGGVTWDESTEPYVRQVIVTAHIAVDNVVGQIKRGIVVYIPDRTTHHQDWLLKYIGRS